MYALGQNANLSFSTTTARASWPSSGAAASLVTLHHVGDVMVNFDKDEFDATTRDEPGFATKLMTLINASITIKLIKDTSDAGYIALRNNFFSNQGATIPIACMDENPATTGAEGLWADMQVKSFKRGEPVKEYQTMDVELVVSKNTSLGTNALGAQYVVTGTGSILG